MQRARDCADEDEGDGEERQLAPAVVREHDHADRDAERNAREPRRQEAPGEAGDEEPGREEREHVRREAADRDAAVVGQAADRREGDDRDRAADGEPRQKKRRTPRKSLVRTGTMRTSLREFGDSIILPPPMYIATCPTTGCS